MREKNKEKDLSTAPLVPRLLSTAYKPCAFLRKILYPDIVVERNTLPVVRYGTRIFQSITLLWLSI